MSEVSDYITCRVCGRQHETGCECPGVAFGEHTVTATPIFVSPLTAAEIAKGNGRETNCPRCMGQGFAGGNPYPCPQCAGRGIIVRTYHESAIHRIGTVLDECRRNNFAAASVDVEDLRALYLKVLTVPTVSDAQSSDEMARLRADASRLDVLDNFCRRIAIRNLPYGDESGRSVFRWQVDATGEMARRPSIREAIDAAIATDTDPCPKGDPDCETGDDGSCHDACEG